MSSAIVLGNFDGIHSGHKTLFDTLKRISKEKNLEPKIITFEPHTRHVIQEPGHPELLLSKYEKKIFMEELSIPHFELPFNKELFAMSFKDFVEKYAIAKYNAKTWVLGFDQRFGRGGKGSAEMLKQFFPELEIIEIPPVMHKGVVVSSSRIRECLKSGDLQNANDMLGRFYSISGIVVHGLQRGRQLGFPTANIASELYKLLPKNGVYAGYAYYNSQKWRAVVNVGSCPSFEERPVGVEAHFLDFDGDLYDKLITVELTEFLRDELKFSSATALVEQINKDITAARKTHGLRQ